MATNLTNFKKFLPGIILGLVFIFAFAFGTGTITTASNPATAPVPAVENLAVPANSAPSVLVSESGNYSTDQSSQLVTNTGSDGTTRSVEHKSQHVEENEHSEEEERD